MVFADALNILFQAKWIVQKKEIYGLLEELIQFVEDFLFFGGGGGH